MNTTEFCPFVGTTLLPIPTLYPTIGLVSLVKIIYNIILFVLIYILNIVVFYENQKLYHLNNRLDEVLHLQEVMFRLKRRKKKRDFPL